MKIVVSYLLILFFPISILAQDEILSKPSKNQYGFHLGINYPNLLYNNKLPANTKVENNLGYALGVSGNYRVSPILVIVPKAELSFNGGALNFYKADVLLQKYEVAPITINTMFHARFNKEKSVGFQYFFVGPNVMIPLTSNQLSSSFDTKTNLAFDLGIGWNQPTKHFNFLPELKYSMGLVNINKNPAIQSLKLHTISLVLNFMG